MALTVTHPYVSSVADSAGAALLGKVLPSHWNSSHSVSGTLDSSQISGTLQSSQYIAPGFISASSNLAFYVSKSGSDTNSGSSVDQFLTITRALDEVAKYDYQQLYAPTINVSSGEYAEALNLPSLYNQSVFGSGVIAGAGSTQTVLFDVGGQGLATAFGPFSRWGIGNVTADGPRYLFYASHQAQIYLQNSLVLTDRSSVATEFFNSFNGGSISISLSNLTITSETYASFYLGGGQESGFSSLLATITLPATTHGSSTRMWIDTRGNGSANFFLFGNTYNNSSYFQGRQVRADGSAGDVTFITSDGTLSQLPGLSSFNTFDSLCAIAKYPERVFTLFGITTSSAPTTTDILPNTWAVANNQSDGSVKIYFNSSGTLLSATLT